MLAYALHTSGNPNIQGRKLMRHTQLMLAALLVFAPFTANADFIDGDITFTGDFVPTGGAGINLGDATGIDFIGDDFDVDGATGDFAAAGITNGDTGFMQDFSFNPLPSTVDPLWSIAGFSFSLTNISIVFQNNAFLILSGSGIVSRAGFEDTNGSWSLTANQADTLFNFSAGSTAVPEPGTLALLGIGLLGMGLTRRRKKT